MTRVLVDPAGVWQRDYGLPLAYVRVAKARTVARLSDPAWRQHGRCATDATDVWFDDPRALGARRARRICRACPVRPVCLGAALLFGEEYGIWGGLDADQRSDLAADLQAGMALESVVASALRNRQGMLDEAV